MFSPSTHLISLTTHTIFILHENNKPHRNKNVLHTIFIERSKCKFTQLITGTRLWWLLAIYHCQWHLYICRYGNSCYVNLFNYSLLYI